MARLGETIDIHAGGADLIFPHHENEIAQSEAATGNPFVRFWIHNGWLLSESRKMSKSLGNYYVLSDIEARGHAALDLRYFYLTNHYRQQFNFTWEGLEGASAARSRIVDFLARLDEATEGGDRSEIPEISEAAHRRFREAMEDDLNTAEALGALHAFLGEVNRRFGAESLSRGDAARIREVLGAFDAVLGFTSATAETIPDEVLALAKERQEARESRDFERADALRDRLAEMGYVLEDTPKGPRVKKA
jgi:cysteinyl-tRNA synthetase